MAPTPGADGRAARGGRRTPDRLTAESLEQLAPYLDRRSLESFRARTAVPWRWLPRVLRAGAVTLGTNVSFKPGSYDQSTPRGLALIAHECVHVRQYREMGFARFLLAYGAGVVRSRGVHDAHPLELEAEALQKRVREELETPRELGG